MPAAPAARTRAPLKIGRIEPRQVALRLAVGGGAGTSAWPGLRRRPALGDAPRHRRPEALPAPEPDEVVPALPKEGAVGVKVEPVGWLGAVRTAADAVVELKNVVLISSASRRAHIWGRSLGRNMCSVTRRVSARKPAQASSAY